MKIYLRKSQGFTIVELLIVIVVLGILAALTFVGYNGMTGRAADVTLKSDLQNAQAELARINLKEGAYPDSLDGITRSEGTLLEYTKSGDGYCVTASSDRAPTNFYFYSSGNSVQEGMCLGHTAGGPQIATAVSLGQHHGCTVAAARAYCWGANTYGQLGDNTATPSLTPIGVGQNGQIGGSFVTTITSGDESACAIVSGSAWCWGRGSSGRLGNNSTADSPVPVPVSTAGVLAGKEVTAISAGPAGSRHTCAVAEGAAYCWGAWSSGVLGNNATADSPVPAAVSTAGVLAGKTVTAISAGRSTTCAVADGAAYCWGANTYGQLGDNGTTSSPVPVAVSTAGVLAGKTVTAISAGGDHTCAIADAEAFCWGRNNYGQLGDSSSTQSLVPVAVSTSGVLAGKSVASISSNTSHNCVIADGDAYCWGRNFAGQLGNNSTSNSSVPVAVVKSGVLSGKQAGLVATGNSQSCAVADRALYCWGSNTSGQLGNNTTSPSSVPVAVEPFPSL